MKFILLSIVCFSLAAFSQEPVFSLRGDSLTAHKSTSGGTAWLNLQTGSTAPAIVTGVSAGVIGDAYINLTQTTKTASPCYVGRGNIGDTGSFSWLFRVRPEFTGTPSSISGFSSGPSTNSNGFFFDHFTNGTMGALLIGAGIVTNFNLTTVATWNPTANVVYDIVLTWNNTTDANQVKFYIDGVSFENRTAANPQTTSQEMNGIWCLGVSRNSSRGFFDFNEVVFWDYVIDPTAVTLSDDSTGSLSGASRTLFVKATAGDPGNPTAGDLRLGTVVGAITGTLNLAGSADIRLAVTHDNGAIVGTLEVPGVGDVRSGTSFDVASTGTMDLTTAANIRSGTTQDNAAITGTLVVPATSTVQVGTVYDNGSVGTLDVISLQNLTLTGGNRSLTIEVSQ